MIAFSNFKFDTDNNVLVDFNGEAYSHLIDTEGCINLVEYNDDLEDALIAFIESLKSMGDALSLRRAKSLLDEYYILREKLCK